MLTEASDPKVAEMLDELDAIQEQAFERFGRLASIPEKNSKPVIEIDAEQAACNLRCPTCFAAAEGHNFL